MTTNPPPNPPNVDFMYGLGLLGKMFGKLTGLPGFDEDSQNINEITRTITNTVENSIRTFLRQDLDQQTRQTTIHNNTIRIYADGSCHFTNNTIDQSLLSQINVVVNISQNMKVKLINDIRTAINNLFKYEQSQEEGLWTSLQRLLGPTTRNVTKDEVINSFKNTILNTFNQNTVANQSVLVRSGNEVDIKCINNAIVSGNTFNQRSSVLVFAQIAINQLLDVFQENKFMNSANVTINDSRKVTENPWAYLILIVGGIAAAIIVVAIVIAIIYILYTVLSFKTAAIDIIK